eukprot:TRINITY_DN2634_c0_g1_i2.p1 TRINITY_DN2634_c0_g1~~TRINITY_DN2634_c0_g1_i2.p1  ORF type:complete len:799 (+),score=129.33 TRINITY_DN2634_c0_g1_i2:33-2429(+)
MPLLVRSIEINATHSQRLSEFISQNPAVTGFILVTLVLSAMLFSFMLNALERAWSSRRHLIALLSKVSREIMILGFISILVFLEGNTGFMNVVSRGFREDFNVHLLEYLHFLFFVTILLFLLATLMMMYIAVRIANYWHETQLAGAALIKHCYEDVRKARRKFGWKRFLHPLQEYKYWALRDQSLFFLAKAKFVVQHENRHGLDSTFNFAAYLTKCVRIMLPDMLEIHPMLYLIILAGIICGTLISKLHVWLSATIADPLMATANWVVFLLSVPLYLHVRRVWTNVVMKLKTRDVNDVEILDQHRKLFMFGQRSAVFVLMQAMMLYHSAFLASFFIIQLPDKIVSWGIALNIVLPVCLTWVLILPRLLPLYAMTTYIGGFSQHHLIERLQLHEMQRLTSRVDLTNLEALLQADELAEQLHQSNFDIVETTPELSADDTSAARHHVLRLSSGTSHISQIQRSASHLSMHSHLSHLSHLSSRSHEKQRSFSIELGPVRDMRETSAEVTITDVDGAVVKFSDHSPPTISPEHHEPLPSQAVPTRSALRRGSLHTAPVAFDLARARALHATDGGTADHHPPLHPGDAVQRIHSHPSPLPEVVSGSRRSMSFTRSLSTAFEDERVRRPAERARTGTFTRKAGVLPENASVGDLARSNSLLDIDSEDLSVARQRAVTIAQQSDHLHVVRATFAHGDPTLYVEYARPDGTTRRRAISIARSGSTLSLGGVVMGGVDGLDGQDGGDDDGKGPLGNSDGTLDTRARTVSGVDRSRGQEDLEDVIADMSDSSIDTDDSDFDAPTLPHV